jgi:hypothetical protein
MKSNGGVTIFFSWQSDSPRETNSSAIRNALKKVIKNMSEKFHIEFNYDEATRGASGSINIADLIFRKISSADVFIADITTITEPGALRPCANPNVLLELGYAAAHIGWERIILLFNESIGVFPGDLPFDIIQNRVSRYSGNLENGQKFFSENLKKLLEVAVGAIVEMDPKTPAELRGVSEDKIKHDRDVANLQFILSQIHIHTLQQHAESLPRYFDDAIFHFWEGFKSVVTSKSVHLYDATIDEAICDLFTSWDATLNFDNRYRSIHNGKGHLFSNPGDAPLDSGQQADWDEIEEAASNMNEALQRILDRVRRCYLEIDLDKTDDKAWRGYVAMQKAFGDG